MKTYGIRLKFGTAIKDFRFMIEEDEGADEKWKEAGKSLEEVGDSCTSSAEFFQKAAVHYAKYGFIRYAK